MFEWGLFSVLVIMGLFGSVAMLPYGLAISGGRLEDMPYAPPVLIALTLAQSAVILAVTTGLGLMAAQAIGLNLPILRALLNSEPIIPLLSTIAPLAILAGSLCGALILTLELGVFRPRIPDSMKAPGQNAAAWQGFLASFYGGINEEILLRLFVFSGSAWLLSRLTNGVPNDAIFWVAIIFAALLFGLGHLPATARLAPLTPLLIARGLLLNAILGIVAGVLFWRYGLEAAMIAHFSADIVLHVLPAPFLKLRQRTRTAKGF